jgi:transketolase
MYNRTDSSDLCVVEQLANSVRRHAVIMTKLGRSSHIGSILSIADILAVLYGKILTYKSNDPSWCGRDRFILSKGHAGAGVYAVLAECGFFSTDKLQTHYQNGSDLSGHVSHKAVPGVELSTGSLGHGLPVAVGIALSAKLDTKNFRTFVLMGDGECDEGSNWEAALFAAHHKLSNLIAIIDRNKLQSIKSTEETIALEPLADKWRAFGWTVKEVDAHNYRSLVDAMVVDKNEENKPMMIIAHSIKGKGVSFMENSVLWHYRSPQDDEFAAALEELNVTS